MSTADRVGVDFQQQRWRLFIPGLPVTTSVQRPGAPAILWDVFVHGCCLFQDVHSRYRTEAHQDVVGRFNERYV